MEGLSLPPNLVKKCISVVEFLHKKHGYKKSVILSKENLLTFCLIPDAFTVLGSSTISFKFRIACWFACLISIILALVFNFWIFLIAIIIVIVERYLASHQRRMDTLLSAMLLSVEILADDYAGWGKAYPIERTRALEILGENQKNSSLDLYIPNRNDQIFLDFFNPAG